MATQTTKLTKAQQECEDAGAHDWVQVTPANEYFCYGSLWATVECTHCKLRLYIEVTINDFVEMALNYYHGSSIEEYVVESNERF